jgi:hypothetical protein
MKGLNCSEAFPDTLDHQPQCGIAGGEVSAIASFEVGRCADGGFKEGMGCEPSVDENAILSFRKRARLP